MQIICITSDDKYAKSGPRRERTVRHFAERGVQAKFFHGVHAGHLGLRTVLPYELDRPGSGFNMGAGPTGCWISHRVAWAAALLLDHDLFFFLEDDAMFPEDWRARVDQAITDAGDFDFLNAGPCCAANKPSRRIAGSVHEVKWPFCCHAYIVRRRALIKLIETQDEARCYAPIDISLTLHTLPHLKAYAVVPRIVDQWDTELHP
jgi:GR25 family glycosyltransferase involved in LPS biosynthesis